ncbi:MAG: hypothetical protein QOF68_553 [Gaiellales bacterium]|jgi:hypothetical protein|nr:hypothetical protein [Gaiellales bacterium]
MRSFGDEQERITVTPRVGEPGPTKPYTTGIKNVLVERDYYTLIDEHGVEHFVVEEAFSQLESAAAEALRVLVNDSTALSDDQRAAWSEFMAFQVSRGRQFREMWARATDDIGKAMLQITAANAPDAYFERISAEAVACGEEPLPPITPELRTWMSTPENYTVRPSQEHTIEMSMVAVEELTAIFFQMSWKLIRFAKPCLISCDHPVSYWREPSERQPMMGIGPLTAREVRIPLSPSLALVLTHPPGIDEVEDATYEARDVTVARCLNRDLLAWPASKQWLTRPDVARHPLPVCAREWAAEWPRPWLRAGRYR